MSSETTDTPRRRRKLLQACLWGAFIGVMLYTIAVRPDAGGLFDGPPTWDNILQRAR